MKGFIYLINSLKNNEKYLGSTSDPAKRINSHNKGHTKTTKNNGPWICELVINVGTIEEARIIEKYIKSQREKLSVNNVVKFLNRYYTKRFDLDI